MPSTSAKRPAISSESFFRGPKNRSSTERSLDLRTSRCNAPASSALIPRTRRQVPSLNASTFGPLIAIQPPVRWLFHVYVHIAYIGVYRAWERWQWLGPNSELKRYPPGSPFSLVGVWRRSSRY